MSEPMNPDRLPRGPHKLTRNEVQESQRTRMIDAMIDAVAEKGYAKTTVGDVLKGAGVSRATFYEQFDDKTDCFGATYASVTDLLERVMDAALTALTADGSPVDPLERIDTLIGWYLDLLSQSPNLAKVFLVEVYATGPQGIEQRRATIDTFVELLSSLLADIPLEGGSEERSFTIRTMVTALVALVTEAAAAGEIDQIPELRDPFRRVVARMFAFGPVEPGPNNLGPVNPDE